MCVLCARFNRVKITPASEHLYCCINTCILGLIMPASLIDRSVQWVSTPVCNTWGTNSLMLPPEWLTRYRLMFDCYTCLGLPRHHLIFVYIIEYCDEEQFVGSIQVKLWEADIGFLCYHWSTSQQCWMPHVRPRFVFMQIEEKIKDFTSLGFKTNG